MRRFLESSLGVEMEGDGFYRATKHPELQGKGLVKLKNPADVAKVSRPDGIYEFEEQKVSYFFNSIYPEHLPIPW